MADFSADLSADMIIVGSGPAGAQAAITALEHGYRVLMLDHGARSDQAGDIGSPEHWRGRSFLELRRTEPEQANLFYGEGLDALMPRDPKAPGATLPPSRAYVVRDVERLTPTRAAVYRAFESLAAGGLGQAWGLGCFEMSDAELDAMGFHTPSERSELRRSTETIVRRIGVSGAMDESTYGTWFGTGGLLPRMPIDESAQRTWKRAKSRRGAAALRKLGVIVGPTTLAMLSQPYESLSGDRRPANSLSDLDLWWDDDPSVYRPERTIRELRGKFPNRFRYESRQLVMRFEESAGAVTVEALSGDGPVAWTARTLVLAAGTLGSTRIAARSVPRLEGGRFPLLTNAYQYMLFFRPSLVGARLEGTRHSMGQLVALWDRAGNLSDLPVLSLLSYRSLLVTRLLREMPAWIGIGAAREWLRAWIPSFTVAGLAHPDLLASPDRSVELEPDAGSPTGDRLLIRWSESDREKLKVQEARVRFKRAMRALGLWHLRTTDTAPGSSIHTGGTLAGHVRGPARRLASCTRVHVVDGSAMAAAPAKGMTLTLMAHADRVVRAISSQL